MKPVHDASGWLCIAGLGPGDGQLVTPEVSAALIEATDVVGYIPYVARIAPRDGLTLHPSDNRVELDRARAALTLAAAGRKVVVVSSGDPGVFAMAAAVFEALEGQPAWQALDIRVLPGITAMLAAAAKAGARLPARTLRWRFTTRARPAGLTLLCVFWKCCGKSANRSDWSFLPAPCRRRKKPSAPSRCAMPRQTWPICAPW